jgi:hypothetical protein
MGGEGSNVGVNDNAGSSCEVIPAAAAECLRHVVAAVATHDLAAAAVAVEQRTASLRDEVKIESD